MIRIVLAAALGCVAAMPAAASTFVPVTKTCPVGGETFEFQELGSISTFGALPDGMPIGSGRFPVALAQCPGNGLVLYKEFSADEMKRLPAIIAAADYRGWRAAGETPYYLAYRLATALGDRDAPWLLLSATWEAKGAEPADPARARRYQEEFVAATEALPADFDPVPALALRARAINALRELGRFDEAAAQQAALKVDRALFTGEDAEQERAGWTRYVESLKAPIARHDASRSPIDMLAPGDVAGRCLARDYMVKRGAPEAELPTLSPFEVQYCARPELAADIARGRAALARMK